MPNPPKETLFFVLNSLNRAFFSLSGKGLNPNSIGGGGKIRHATQISDRVRTIITLYCFNKTIVSALVMTNT